MMMLKKNHFRGLILSIADGQGPRPKSWFPEFTDLTHIYNSAVKSFSILLGDRAYRKDSFQKLSCFGILPFLDMKSVGFIQFSGVESWEEEEVPQKEIPATLTLIFDDAYRDKLCQHSPQLHQFLKRETKIVWPSLREEEPNTVILSELYDKIKDFLEKL